MGQSLNLINAHIITLDESNPIAHSISVNNGKINAINSVDNSFKTIDCKGATIIPGFVDAHMHLTNLGKRMEFLQLKDAQSAEDVAELVLQQTKILPEGTWIQGFGWNQTQWNNQNFPDQNILNKISPNHPVILTRIDGHSAWVNDLAIKLGCLNVDNCPEGGEIINKCILIDNAMNPISKIIPKDSSEDIQRWIKNASQKLVSMGIANVHDAWQDVDIIEGITAVINEDRLSVRVYGMLANNDETLLTNFFKNGHLVSDFYTIRTVKIFMDGALGSRGAALLEPYSDDDRNSGLILKSKDEFKKFAQRCYVAGFQLCTHAIGDRTNRLVLDVYSDILGGKNNHRWRIEHAQMVHNDDISKFKKSNIIPSMQPTHCTSDMPWLKKRLGSHRLHEISRWQTFINDGVKIPGGSDCPIEDGNPLFEFYSAVTRKNHDGLPENGWQSQENVSRINALKMFTTWAAYGEFTENRRGKIKPGFDADFTILSNDITQCSELEILNTEILYTIVNGKIVFAK